VPTSIATRSARRSKATPPADRPVIIGGGRRGARLDRLLHRPHQWDPLGDVPALKACPDAVVIPPDMDKYARVGREVRALMLELTPQVEPLSIDEAFMDLSGTERLHHASPALSLARLARRIEAEIGITVSIGLSFNKFLAKIASDLRKPRGFAVIGREEAVAFLGPAGKSSGERRQGHAQLAGTASARWARSAPAEADLVRRYSDGAAAGPPVPGRRQPQGRPPRRGQA
jgi:DNA polymerase-4